MRKLILILLAFIFTPVLARASQYEMGSTPIEGYRCDAKSDACFKKALSYLKRFKVPLQDEVNTVNSALETYELAKHYTRPAEQGARIVTVGQRTPVAILFIHGFAMDSRQFLVEQSLMEHYGINSVSVTLPGHGPFASVHEKVTYHDWLHAVREALQLTTSLGDKVVVAGQSTGAELGFSLALENPGIIKGLVLIDPAFQLRKYLQWSTCVGQEVLGDARELGILADLFQPLASRLPNPVSLHMGCEVSRLAKDLVRRFGAPDSNASQASTRSNSYENMFRKIRVPTLISYTSRDTVVNPDVIQKMLDEVNPRFTVAYNWAFQGETPSLRDAGHGQVAQFEELRHGFLPEFLRHFEGVSGSYLYRSYAFYTIKDAYKRFVVNLPQASRCLSAVRKLASYDKSKAIDSQDLETLAACPTLESLDQGLGAACHYFNSHEPSCSFLDDHFFALNELSNTAYHLGRKSSSLALKSGLLAKARDLVSDPSFQPALKAFQASDYVDPSTLALRPDMSPHSLDEICHRLSPEYRANCHSKFPVP